MEDPTPSQQPPTVPEKAEQVLAIMERVKEIANTLPPNLPPDTVFKAMVQAEFGPMRWS